MLYKGRLYGSIGKGSMISVYKIEPSYVTIKKHRGYKPPEPPAWFLCLCLRNHYFMTNNYYSYEHAQWTAPGNLLKVDLDSYQVKIKIIAP